MHYEAIDQNELIKIQDLFSIGHINDLTLFAKFEKLKKDNLIQKLKRIFYF
ncbi:MAG: hypothetical protein GXP45_03880 [bacterium]|nr:hypothetical protein [bacterium]